MYGLALFGVHRARGTQLKAARLSGVLQLVLAAGALAEVVRRLVFGSEPEAPLMVVVADTECRGGYHGAFAARHEQKSLISFDGHVISD